MFFHLAANQSISQFIKSCLFEIQNQTNCFDINSILIKPVQRILKYPLLLNELIKFTEPEHEDMRQLQMSLQMITTVATTINEHKRRQDLIQKYAKRSGDIPLTERIKSLNMHTVKKKGFRLGYRVLSHLPFGGDSKVCSQVQHSIPTHVI